MDLPRIQSPEPVVIDPLPTEYPDLFLSDFRYKGLPGKTWRLSAVFLPYNYTAGVLQPNGTPKELILDDLRAKAEQYPTTIGMMLGGILQYLPLLHREAQLLAVENPTAEQQAELTAIQSALTGA